MSSFGVLGTVVLYWQALPSRSKSRAHSCFGVSMLLVVAGRAFDKNTIVIVILPVQ